MILLLSLCMSIEVRLSAESVGIANTFLFYLNQRSTASKCPWKINRSSKNQSCSILLIYSSVSVTVAANQARSGKGGNNRACRTTAPIGITEPERKFHPTTRRCVTVVVCFFFFPPEIFRNCCDVGQITLKWSNKQSRCSCGSKVCGKL